MISPVERFPVSIAAGLDDEDGVGGRGALSLRRREPEGVGASAWLALLLAVTAGAVLGLVLPLPL